MKKLRQLVLEQVAAGRLGKDQAAEMLAGILKAQRGSLPDTSEVAIIGMACRLPPNSDLARFWSDLSAGVEQVRAFPESRRQDIDALVALIARQSPAIASQLQNGYYEAAFLDRVDVFDYQVFGIAPAEARLIDPQQRVFVEVVQECLENAGYSRKGLSGSKTGVYVSYSEAEYERLIPPGEPSAVHAAIPAMLAGRVSYVFNLTGPSQVIETTCSSSLVAVHNACRAIANGDCDMALAGGVRLLLFPFAGGQAGAPQVGIDSPDGRTRAFDKDGNGSGGGEGAGVILLKPLAQAIKDRDHIHAIIKGSAVNSDGKSSGATAPNPVAQSAVIVTAWQRAAVDPETITYIEAHGTATKLGDPIEIEGLTNAFRRYTDKRHFCAIGSVKTNLGHLSGAAGIVGLIKTVLAMQHKQIPPSLHFDEPNPFIDFENAPVFVNSELRAWDVAATPRRAGVSSFGVTGTNCHVLLEEYVKPEDGAAERHVANHDHLFTLSAATRKSLGKTLDKYIRFLSSADAQAYSLENICYTANTGRDVYAHRLAVIAQDVEDLLAKLHHTSEHVRSGSAEALTEDSICYGVVSNPGGNLSPGTVTLDRSASLAELAQLYTRTPRVQWGSYYDDQGCARVPLPTYAFDGKRCWTVSEAGFSLLDQHLQMALDGRFARDAAPDRTDWLYTLRWRAAPLETGANMPGLARGNWLLLMDELGISAALATRLADLGCETIQVYPGDSFGKTGERRYQVGPKSQADWGSLLHDLSGRGQTPLTGVVHLWTCTDVNAPTMRRPDYVAQQDSGVFSLFAFVKKVVAFQQSKPLDVWIVSNYLHQVTGAEECLLPAAAPLWGLTKVIPQEYGWMQCYCVDVATAGQTNAGLANNLLAEIGRETPQRDYVVAYREKERFVQQIERADMTRIEDRPVPIIKEGGVYLLAGGAGNIGLGIGKHFAEQAKVKLVLVNRSKLPARSEWPNLISAGNSNSQLLKRLVGIREIEKLGSEVLCFSADVGDVQAMERVLKTVAERYGRLDGVVNATMQVNRKTIPEQNQEEFESSVLNRIRGALVLDQVTRSTKLDFFIVLSSISSVFGGRTEADDAASNLFLDAYGLQMSQAGRDVTVMSLTGIQDQRTRPQGPAETLLPPIGADDLRALLDIVMNKRIRFTIIEDFDFGVIRRSLPVLRVKFSETLLAQEAASLPIAQKEIEPLEQSRPQVGDGHKATSYNEIEQKVTSLWLQVLGYENVGVYDNFFDLGGDSLMALRLLEEVKKSFSLDLDVNDIYRHPSIADMANHLERLLAASGSPTPSREIAQPAPSPGDGSIQPAEETPRSFLPGQSRPLSFFQERLWVFERLDPGNPVNAISFAARVTGRLNVAALFQSLNEIVRRHEILRTTFTILEEQPVQIVTSDPMLVFPAIDLQELEPDRQITAMRRLAAEDAHRPFDLTRGPMLRATLIKLGDDDHAFLTTVHHIVFDGWSMGILFQEIAVLYAAFSEGKPSPLPDLPFQFADLARQQRQRLQGQPLQDLISYWKEQLAGAPLVLELPTDYPRPPTLAFLGQNYPLALSQDLSQKIRDLSQQESVTPFITVLAALAALLRLYSGQNDLVVGAFSAHRNRPETKKLIGPFVNTLIIRVDFSGRPTFLELLARVRQVVLEASAHQELTFEQIVEAVQPQRDASRMPLVQAVLDFNVDPMQGVEFSDLKLTPLKVEKKITRFDLALEMMDNGEQGLSGVFEYNTELFKPTTIARMAEYFETFLKSVVTEPDTRV